MNEPQRTLLACAVYCVAVLCQSHAKTQPESCNNFSRDTLFPVQVAAIQREIALRGDIIEVLKSKVDISVSSVDAYQGREADAVIFSATRNNPQGKIGFLKDSRRLNVAITRPRRALVIIAAPGMIGGDANWAKCVLSPFSPSGAMCSHVWITLCKFTLYGAS